MLAVTGGEAVAQEEHVELAALGRGGDVLHQAEFRSARHRIRMTPAGHMMAGRLHEDAEAHLPSMRHLHHQAFRFRLHAGTGP